MIHQAISTFLRLFAVSLAVSCALPIALATPASTKNTLAAKVAPPKILQSRKAAPTRTDTKSAVIQLKAPPISVRAASNLGYIVSFNPPYSQRRGQPYLLSVRGISLRSKTPQEVKRLLQGKPGSTIRIGVLQEDGRTEDIDLLIPLEQKLNDMFSPEEFYGSIERFNTEEIHPNLLERDKTNNDLLAKSYCNDSAQRCLETQESETNTLSTIFQSLFISQAIGDFTVADRYLQQALTALNENSGRLRTLQFPLANIIKNLVALGKKKEATTICHKLASPEYQAAGEHIDPFKILECLSMIETAQSRATQLELIERLYPIYSAEQIPNSENLLWFGQLLEGRDKTPERALVIYSAQENRLQETVYQQPSLANCQRLAECMYLKAQAQSKLGNTGQALLDLDNIRVHCNSHLPVEQLALLDQLPLYFPTPSDVTAAEAALKLSQPMPPLPPIACHPWYEPAIKGKPGEYSADISLQFPTANACFEAIKRGDKKNAVDMAQRLLRVYKNEPPDEEYLRSRQNLFCTNMRIARALVDKEWTCESEHLLNELASTIGGKDLDPDWSKMAVSIIEAEQLVNLVSCARIDKRNLNKAWDTFENSYLEVKPVGKSIDAKRISLNYEKCKRLRLLAMNYSFADEYKRAKLFFDRALQVEPDLITNEEALRHFDKQLDERFLLRINLAMLLARKGDYTGADKYIKLAQEQQPTTNQDVIGSLIKTADIFNQAGQIDRSIDLMKKILAQELVDQYCSVAQLKTKLAAILFRKGVNSEASKLVELSTATLSSALVASNYGRAAEVAEKAGNYKEAAKYYSLAGQSFNTEDTKAQALLLLSKAIASAEESKDLDRETLATYYLGLADRSGYQNMSSIKLRDKALTLMSDINPKKPEVMRYTAYLRREARRDALPPELKKETIPKESDDARGRIIRLLQPTAAELESDFQAANLAAKNRLPDVGDYWMGLAMAEAQAEKPENACAHARLSIAAYSKNDPRATTSEQIIGNSGISTFLALSGAREKGSIIFREAIKRIQDVQGQSSVAAQVQMAHYFDFCVNERFRIEAVEILDELLATDLNQGRYAPPDPNMSVCCYGWGGPPPIESSFEAISIINATILDCFKRRDTDLGLIAANSLVAAERKQFPAGDYRTAFGTAILARGLSQWADKAKAEALFREAKPILEKHGSWDNETNTIFRQLLKEVGKQDEVDKMDEAALKEREDSIKRDEARNK